MGFVALAVIGGLAFAGLLLLRVPRALWSFVGAALCLGAAGYAWQGRPGWSARVATPNTVANPVEPETIALRDRLLGGHLTADAAYITASDAMTRVGDRRAAAQVILGGLHNIPRSFILWTQLGTVIAARDGDQMSPPALFAFQQALRLAPEHPAPAYFAGLAYIRAGEFDKARILWARALALSPVGASYREDIALRLALLDRYIAASAQPER